jgi:hypothetical protein
LHLSGGLRSTTACNGGVNLSPIPLFEEPHGRERLERGEVAHGERERRVKELYPRGK